MPSWEPATQPTNVTTAGVIVTLPIHAIFGAAARRNAPVSRIEIVKDAGDATTLTWELSAEALVDDELATIAKGTGVTMPVDEVPPAVIPWKPIDENLYLKLVPNAGTNNNFRVRVFTAR